MKPSKKCKPVIKVFGKKKPEDLSDGELRQIVNRLMADDMFRHHITNEVRHAFIEDIDTRQIVLEKVNALLDEILCNESNIENIRKAVIRQIDEMHNVKILLDRLQRKNDDNFSQE